MAESHPDPSRSERGRERTAIVLGAGSPWGSLVSEGLARSDYRVLLVDGAGEGFARSRERATEAGGSVQGLVASWAGVPEVLSLPRQVPSEWTRPSLLVHVLPPPVPGHFSERRPEEISREVHRGYTSLVAFSRDLLPGMIEAGGGRVIVLGSAAARAPLAKAAVHSALARALAAFLTSLDREVHRQGIGISYLEPAGFASPPVPPGVARGPSPLHREHRRFLVSDAAVAHAFQRALRSPRLRQLRFHGHDRSPPPPSALRRYAEREFHGQVPEDPEDRVARGPTHVPPRDLQGRIALVTGASRGIGKAIAVRLASRGMRLLLTARDPVALEGTAAEVRKAGGDARTLPLDLMLPEAPEALRSFSEKEWGMPWLLVNNAGIAYFRRLVRQEDAQLTSQVQVDLVSLLTVTRAFLPAMLEAGHGEVLNIGSMAPEVPLPRLATYSGIKGAVKGFTVAMDRELSHRGVRASVLEPVTVDTELITRGAEPGRKDVRQGRALRTFIIHADEVANLAERTVIDPRPVVLVPPRARALLWAYRACLPVLDRTFRLPAPRKGGPTGEPAAQGAA